MEVSLDFALVFGFMLGLKHATEADHLVAVTAIVSEQRSIRPSALVGMRWGLGHTASLLLAGVVVILLRTTIPRSIATVLEFAVALMIIFLGTRILYLMLRQRRRIHVHTHAHDGYAHTHLHFHDEPHAHIVAPPQSHAREVPHRHAGLTSWNAVIVGIVHGLAGSAALTLLVLAEVVRSGSRALGLAYLLVFGLGSIAGMLLMSTLISLPLVLTSRHVQSMVIPMRLVVAASSIVFGVYYAWTLGIKL